MNIKVILLFITINIFLFSQYTAINNNYILVNMDDKEIDYATYTIHADATANYITDSYLHPGILLILQQQAEEETMKALYDTLNYIPVYDENTIYSILEENRTLKEKVISFIYDARLVGISYPTRKSVKVSMALDIITNQLLYNLINNMNVYKTEPIVTYFDAGADYDSLVIDARNIGFNPSLFPIVYDEDGNEIYDLAYINKDVLSTNAYVVYSKDPFLTNQNIIKIVGENPYKAVAWRPRGRFSSDLVIGNEDASIIMSSKKLRNAIKNCKVVFIIN